MLAIGLMSGTSCDGVDAALIETDGISIQKFIAEYHLPYPDRIQKSLSELMHSHNNWFEIENQLTQYHAKAVKLLINSLDSSSSDIDLDNLIIGFHGQTIYHAPQQGICWQIGNPHLLAHLTGFNVVSDFRRRDVAGGGQGAPLIPIFHQALVHHHKSPVAIVNIGGVSNVTYIGEQNNLLGYDLGPGNALINDAMMLHYNKPYDEDGLIAKSGQVDSAVIEQLMSNPFFEKIPPKSLDRNHFIHAHDLLKNHVREDIIATLTAFTSESIAKALGRDLLKYNSLEELYLCGGGSKNKTMIELLRSRMPQTKISHIEKLGFKSDFIEAQGFAFLAARYIQGLPSTFPSTTGVNKPTIAGALFIKS